MSTLISFLITIFLVDSIGKIFIAAIDAKQQEKQIEELQKRIKELEDK